jgi:cysteine desulfurase/selenocysteine lyase
MFDVEKIRKDFPILKRTVWGDKKLVYFDNAATTQKPNVVISALVDYYENINANIHRGVHKLAEEATTAYENVRLKVRKLLNADGNTEIIFTRNTTESINLLSYTFGESLYEGDEVLISEMEHHSNIIPWYILKNRKHISVKFIPVTDKYELDYEALSKLVTKKTKIISVAHKSNVLGTVNDIKKISAIACSVGAVLVVDAAQSVPHMKINFNEMGCDFIAFSAHKMCGPTGVGVLAGKKELFEKMPPFMGGGEMIRKVTFDGFTVNDLPWKYEAGTPNIADVIAFEKAVDYVQSVGMQNIYNYECELTSYALNSIKQFDFLKLYGPVDAKSRAGILTFSNPVVHPHDIATIIDQYGVAIRAGHHCAQPLMKKLGLQATCRASFYFYNTKEEIDIFINALKSAFDYFAVGACKDLTPGAVKGVKN